MIVANSKKGFTFVVSSFGTKVVVMAVPLEDFLFLFDKIGLFKAVSMYF